MVVGNPTDPGICIGDVADMATKTVTPKGEFATDDEVEAAIAALTEADAIRLNKIAAFRARSLQGLGLGIGPDDLLQDALMRTVNGAVATGPGARRWRKGIPFVKHLDQTMRSIASHARENLEDITLLDASEVHSKATADGPFASRRADPERLAAAREQLALVHKKFADDDLVGLVIEGLADEMTGPDIQKDLGITETQFESAMTKLRRGVDREGGWRP